MLLFFSFSYSIMNIIFVTMFVSQLYSNITNNETAYSKQRRLSRIRFVSLLENLNKEHGVKDF
jgi:hypothetical protein